MARRTMLTAAKNLKTKKVKASKVAQFLADTKHMGDEPEVKGQVLSGPDLMRVLNWYNYMCTRKDARDYIETYLKQTGRAVELKRSKIVPDAWVNLQAGWFARIMLRGGALDRDGSTRNFDQRLGEMLVKAGVKTEDEIEKPEVEKPKATIQVRSEDKASDLIGELDELIDSEGWTVDVYDWLTKRQIAPAHARKIRDFFKPIYEEAIELSGRNADKQLLEGYKNLTKVQIKERTLFYTKLIQDCERFADVAKKQKAPRKKKPVSVEKKLKGFKFMPEAKDFKVVSVNPEKVIGAQELWTFNTKYKTVHVFTALDAAGINVKGTTFTNYNEETSKGYRLGRKVEDAIGILLAGKKRPINELTKKLKETTLQHRCNDYTILLRIA